MDDGLQQCINLLKENEEQLRNAAECTLLTLCQKILSRPKEKRYREVRLDDPVVIETLLPASGAMECLFDIGFTEVGDHIFLPYHTPLSKLQTLKEQLSVNIPTKCHKSNSTENQVKNFKKTCPEHEQFFTNIERKFESVLCYENEKLQEKARKIIPVIEFEIAALKKMREIQKSIKESQTNVKENAKADCSETGVIMKDLFLAELLFWFKYKFFSWVDQPKCPACFGETSYQSIQYLKDPACSRVEFYRCNECKKSVKFPRYHDPEILLTLRRGRCGEWANVFTLLCRALKYDARIVYDETDHVWTEVWSVSEKRWIHVDPCENVIDQPLMYEKGWKKKLSYIIAYSKDEVQDVTWRYTQNQVAVLKRRTRCSESKLLRLIELLNLRRQYSAGYSATRGQYVIRRRLMELVELIHMPNEQEVDDGKSYQGRSTGSYAWRLARGEITQENSGKNYSWDVSKNGQTFQLSYSIVRDVYKVTNDNDTVIEEKSGWEEGVATIEGGVFRKIENDWKMVYLSRSPNATYGRINWYFVVKDPHLSVHSFRLRTTAQAFHDATISWEIQGFFSDKVNLSETISLTIYDFTNFYTEKLKGAVKLILTATISGGQGDSAWQHAQLFRQSLESEEQSMVIDIQLNKR